VFALSTERRRWQELIVTAMAASVAAIVLLAPDFGDLHVFLNGQLGSSLALQVGSRTGDGLFPELISPGQQIVGIWGLGASDAAVSTHYAVEQLWNTSRLVLSGLLCLFLLVGFVELARRRELATSLLLLLIVAAIGVMILKFSYPYGAYKILFTGWSIISLCLALGLERSLTIIEGLRPEPVPRLAFLAFLTVLGMVVGGKIMASGAAIEPKTMGEFRVAETIDALAGQEPVALDVKDFLANEWAVYFLRETKSVLVEYRSYMTAPHVIPSMARSATWADQPVGFVLTDAAASPPMTGAQEVWSGGAYELWAVPDSSWVLLGSVSRWAGADNVGGTTGYWLSGAPSQLQVLAGQNGSGCLTATPVPIPGATAPSSWRIAIGVDGASNQDLDLESTERFQVAIPTRPGTTELSLAAYWSGSGSLATPTTDLATPIVGLRDLSVTVGECAM
jgi:hypothetical protein